MFYSKGNSGKKCLHPVSPGPPPRVNEILIMDHSLSTYANKIGNFDPLSLYVREETIENVVENNRCTHLYGVREVS